MNSFEQKFYRFRSFDDWDTNRFLSEMDDIRKDRTTFVKYSYLNDPFETALENNDSCQWILMLNIINAFKALSTKLNLPCQNLNDDKIFQENEEVMNDLWREFRSHLKADSNCLGGNISAEYVNFMTFYDIYKNLQQKHKIFIYSLTKKINSIYYWSHYAGSHKGYSLELTFNKPYFDRITLGDLREAILNSHLFFPQKINYNINNKAQPFFLTKTADWAQEEEYRLILFDFDGPNRYGEYRKIHTFREPKAQISAIYLGCRFNQYGSDKEIYLYRLAIEKKIKIYQMKEDREHLSLYPEMIFDPTICKEKFSQAI